MIRLIIVRPVPFPARQVRDRSGRSPIPDAQPEGMEEQRENTTDLGHTAIGHNPFDVIRRSITT